MVDPGGLGVQGVFRGDKKCGRGHTPEGGGRLASRLRGGNLPANAISGFGLGRILGLAYSCRRDDGDPVLSWLLA
jgi:hypothetical protein